MPDHHDHEPAHRETGSLEDLILSALPSRRKALWFLGASALSTSALAACGGGSGSGTGISTSGAASSSSSSSSASSSSASSSSASSASGECTLAATETNGPYPADGTNSVSGSIVNVLNESGVVRSDITFSFGGYSGTAAGVPLTLTITVEDYSLGCTPLAGYAVYIWHCDRSGLYSLYSSGVTAQNYLRGVQVTDANGQVTFTTIFPACYSGRMPHIHVEVYASLSTATTANNAVKIAQLAFDRTICETVYNNASGYSASIRNLAAISFASDNVFGDDTPAQLAAATVNLTGDYTSGFTGTVSVAAP
jgi:protocatechuate 3,4-dioxygenase beta subunit